MSTPSPVRRILRWALFSLLLFGLPLFLLDWGFGRYVESHDLLLENVLFQRMETMLSVMSQWEETPDAVSRYLTSLFHHSLGNRTPGREFRKAISRFHRSLPGVASFALVFEQKVIQADPGLPANLKSLPDLVRILDRRNWEDQLSGLKQSWPSFSPLFRAPTFPEMLVFRPSEIFQYSPDTFDEFFFCKGGRAVSGFWGLVVFVRKTPDWHTIALHQFIRGLQASRLGKYFRFGTTTFAPGPEGVPVEVREAYAESLRINRSRIRRPGHLFGFQKTRGDNTLWVMTARPRDQVRHLIRAILAPLLLLVFLALTGLAWQVMVVNRPLYLSIRWQLRLLFLWATGIPLLILFFAGWDFQNQTYRTLLQNRLDQGEQYLHGAEIRFRQQRGEIQRFLNHHLNRFQIDDDASRRRLKAWLESLPVFILKSDPLLFQTDGRLEPYFGPYHPNAVANQRLVGGLISSLLARLNRTEKQGLVDSTELLIETVAGDDNPINSLARTINQINEYYSLGKKSWAYLHPFTNRSGVATHVMTFIWGRNNVLANMLPRILAYAHRQHPDWHFYSMLPQRPNELANTFLRTHFGRLLGQMNHTEGIRTAVIPYRDGNLLFSCLYSRELETTYLVAVTTDRPIWAQINRLRLGVLGIGLLCLISSLFLAHQLSAVFLAPVQELTLAVEAIDQRLLDHRLPPGNDDELGDLMATFNRALEGMGDLEIAKIVQESLLPKDPLKSGEYLIYGTSVSASQLGGDYFDYSVQSNGHLMFFLGDVTGHGVPAALVMAMVKALFEQEGLQGFSGERAIANLHRVIFRTMKRKRMMTAFLGVLKPEEHRLYCWPAGQTFPLIVRANGNAAIFECPAFPLGGLKKPSPKALTLDFSPGDSLFFCSDGLTEAVTATGETLTYDSVMAAIPPLLTSDPQTSCQNVSAWHRRLTGGQPQNDDITLLMLHRQSASPTVSST